MLSHNPGAEGSEIMSKLMKTAALATAVLLIGHSAFAEITVTVNDEVLPADGQTPVIINDRTYVPLRKIFEALGAYVEWDGDTQTVFAYKRMKTVSMTVGASEYYVDAVAKSLDAPPVIIDERTMIPVRAVSEALGAEVVWNEPNRTVSVSERRGAHQIRDVYLDFWESNESGRVVLTGRAAYPEIISGVTEVTAAFNEFMSGEAEELCDKAAAELGQEVKQTPESAAALPYMFEHSFDITYDSNDIISIRFADSTFTGGAHSDYRMSAVTYNLATGAQVEATELFGTDEQSVRASVKAEFERMLAEKPEGFFSDAESCIDEALDKMGWYLAEDGVHFFVNPYIIAPFARGTVEAVIPIKH